MSATGDVVIVDLGLGNLRSVHRALERAGGRPRVASEPDAARGADRLVVPGQGAFRDCARSLAGAFGEVVVEHIRSGRPYLGICLGMQALFAQSDEAPGERGLALFEGHVRRFAPGRVDAGSGRVLKVPHMGWNEVEADHPGLPSREWFYFVHSYHCVPEADAVTVARADYGGPFCAAVARDNVLACQFHPEKSHRAGQRVLESFLLEAPWS